MKNTKAIKIKLLTIGVASAVALTMLPVMEMQFTHSAIVRADEVVDDQTYTALCDYYDSASAFLSMHNVVSNWCRANLRIFVPFVPLAISFLRRRLKTDPENYSPKFNAGKLSCPALFIFGDNDRLIPAADRDELFRLCSSPDKEIFVINGATHTKCAETGGVLYRDKISAFFAKIFPAAEMPSKETKDDMPKSSGTAYVNSPKLASDGNLPDNSEENKSSSTQKKNKKKKKNR